MQRKLLLLLLFVLTAVPLSFGTDTLSLGVSGTVPACPSIIHLNNNVSSCKTFCNNLHSQYGNDFDLCATMGTITSNPINYCSCLLVPKGSGCLDLKKANNPPTGYLWCEYQISNFKKQASKFLNNPFFSADIPETMVKMATFDSSSPALSLPGAAGIVFNGLYSTYVAAISGITTSFALVVLIIVSGWNLGLSLFTRFVKKMEGTETPWSTMTSSYWHGKAMMVIPAAAFFSLPLPMGSTLLNVFHIGLPGKPAVTIQFSQNASGYTKATVSVDNYNSNPTPSSVLKPQMDELQTQCSQIYSDWSKVSGTLSSLYTAAQTAESIAESICQSPDEQLPISASLMPPPSSSGSCPSGFTFSSGVCCPSGYSLMSAGSSQVCCPSGYNLVDSPSGEVCVSPYLSYTMPTATSDGYYSCPSGYSLDSYDLCTQANSGSCQAAIQAWQNAMNKYEDIHTKADNLLSQYKECEEQYNELKNAIPEIPVKPNHLSGIISFTYPSASSLRLPLALGVVKGFIDEGLKYGDTVAGMASSYIESYTVYKISHEIAMARAMNSAARRDYQKEIQNLDKEWQAIAKADKTCFAGMSEAEICQATASSKVPKIIQEHTKCKVIYDMAKSMCSELAKYQPPKPPPKNDTTASDVASALGPIQSATGFLYPAFIPEVSIYSLFKAVSQPEDFKATATLSHYDSVDFTNESVVTSARNNDILKQLEGSVKAVNHTSMQNLSPSAGLGFILGEVTAVNAIPPGSTIAHMMSELSKALSKGTGQLLGLLAQAIKAPIHNGVYRSAVNMLASGAKNVTYWTAYAYGMFISFGLTVTLLKFIPFFIVSFAVLGRFFGYFLGIMKFILSLPFYAVAVATERPGSWSSFFKHVVKFTMVPPALAFIPLVSFAVIELSRFLFFDIPSYFILSFAPNTFVGEFMAGFGVAFMYMVSTAIAVILAWEVAFNFVDGLFEFLDELIGKGSDTAVQSFRTIGSIVKYRFASGLAQGA